MQRSSVDSFVKIGNLKQGRAKIGGVPISVSSWLKFGKSPSGRTIAIYFGERAIILWQDKRSKKIVAIHSV